MGRQESLQLIERKTQVDTDAQETSRASKYSNMPLTILRWHSHIVLATKLQLWYFHQREFFTKTFTNLSPQDLSQ